MLGTTPTMLGTTPTRLGTTPTMLGTTPIKFCVGTELLEFECFYRGHDLRRAARDPWTGVVKSGPFLAPK